MAKLKLCSIDGCGKPHKARGFCFPHYKREWRSGRLELKRPRSGPKKHCGKRVCPGGDRLDSRLWAAKNKARQKATGRRHYEQNREQYIARANSQPREQTRAAKRRYDKRNPAKLLVHGRLRKRRIKQAAPSWLTEEHWQQMNAVYQQARELAEETGIDQHVDHIMPLRGGTVCGLHVPWNLRVLTAKQNMERPRDFSG